MKKKLIIIIIIAVIVIIGGLTIVKKKQESLEAIPKPKSYIPAVQATQVNHGALEVTVHYMGIIEPTAKTDLSSRITASILSINKREGDFVKKSDELVLLDDKELSERHNAIKAEMLSTRQKLTGAKSAYETQKTIHRRDQKLFKVGAISGESLERSKALYDGAKSVVDAYQESIKGLTMNAEAAKTQVGYARILSPFSGIVTKRFMESGDMAVPGKPILTIENTSSYKVTVQIPQQELSEIKIGSKVYLKNQNQVMTAKVTRIYPALGKNMLASVETVLPSIPFNLSSGAYIGVDLLIKEVTGLIVPENALIKNEKGNFVCIVKDNLVNIKPVKILGNSNNGKAAVQGEISAGEKCVVGQENRLLTLKDGIKVNISAGDSK